MMKESSFQPGITDSTIPFKGPLAPNNHDWFSGPGSATRGVSPIRAFTTDDNGFDELVITGKSNGGYVLHVPPNGVDPNHKTQTIRVYLTTIKDNSTNAPRENQNSELRIKLPANYRGDMPNTKIWDVEIWDASRNPASSIMKFKAMGDGTFDYVSGIRPI